MALLLSKNNQLFSSLRGGSQARQEKHFLPSHRGFHVEFGAREKSLLEEDSALKKFKSHKKAVGRVKIIGDVLIIAVVAGPSSSRPGSTGEHACLDAELGLVVAPSDVRLGSFRCSTLSVEESGMTPVTVDQSGLFDPLTNRITLDNDSHLCHLVFLKTVGVMHEKNGLHWLPMPL